MMLRVHDALIACKQTCSLMDDAHCNRGGSGGGVGGWGGVIFVRC